MAKKRKSSFQVLKENKVKLSADERAEVKRRGAEWSDGSSAVWKSVNPKTGKATFVTNTHRAYNTAPTCRGACGRFHKFIKSTA